MAQSQPPIPDETTKLVGIAYLLANVLWFAVSNFNKVRAKGKKRTTDETGVVMEFIGKQKEIEGLESALAIRNDQVEVLEARVAYLKPFENEVLTLRSVVDLKDKRIDELVNALKSRDGGEKTKPITPPLTDEH